MLAQTSAFLTRSIRQESRLLSHHITRCGMVLLMMYLLVLQILTSPRLGASGLELIRNVMNCCYWCLTLLGLMYFSAAITEEKEEETLPLLRMTGVRNRTLLLGKSLPRLAVVVLLIMVAAPFLMLAVTLGGVVREQIVASLVGLMCYAFCLSQAGLFASTVSQNSGRAASGMFVLWLILEFGNSVFMLLSFACTEWQLNSLATVSSEISGWLAERTFWNASSEYLMFDRGEAIWHAQMTFHLIMGAAFFRASLLVFEYFNQHSIAQGAAANVVVRRGLPVNRNSLQSLRCWDAAMAWKSWQFVGGGLFWFRLLLVGLPALSVSVIVIISMMAGEYPPFETYGISLMLVGVASLVLVSGKLFGNVFNGEVHQQTLVSLCMLPQKRSAVLSQLAIGLWPFMIPPVVCFGFGCLVLSLTEDRFFSDTIDVIKEPWLWASLSWAVVTLHFGTLLSVYFRRGGMLVAIAVCWFLLPFACGMMIAASSAFARGLGPSDDFFQYLVPVFLMIGHVAACIVIQKLIIQRVETLAAR